MNVGDLRQDALHELLLEDSGSAGSPANGPQEQKDYSKSNVKKFGR